MSQDESTKRHAEDQYQTDLKKVKTEDGLNALASASASNDCVFDPDSTSSKPVTKARENRLEQNRKAARESRRRKKFMIEGKIYIVLGP